MLQHLRSAGRFRPALLPLLAVFALAAGAAAQTQTLIYGLSENGKLCVNGTVLDALTTAFDADPLKPASTEQRWWDLAVRGADRFALRLDGRLAKNGKNLFKLPFLLAANAAVWTGLAVTPTKVYALRSDGLLTADGGDVQNFPVATFVFQRCVGIDPNVYVMRTDGSIFQNTTLTPLIKFTAGPGIGPTTEGSAHAQWLAFAANPVNGELYGLRLDGKLWKADPAASGTTPLPGSSVIDLPFPIAVPQITNGTLYIGLSFTADGAWSVLRGDGAVFSAASALDPLIDLPGTQNGAPDETFYDIASSTDHFFAVRWDGKVFDDTGTQQFDMINVRYRAMAFSDTPPDLTNFKNPPPKVATYKTRAIEGVPVKVPLLVSDVEKLPEELVVTAPDVLPAGSTWDEPTRTLTWDNPGPVGTYTYKQTVSDGVNPPKKLTQKIKVLAADTDLEKNKAPLPTKIGKVQAQVGFPITFQVFAVDPDGDPVTFSVNTAKPPFTQGATFDDVTNTFSWTPTFEDIGAVTANFKATDDVKTVTLAVSLKVINPLIF